ncbi:hypothetical protein AB0I53_21095 [Saccharopolyspora sp. NPDC050389]|uniref:hypothetical protein n=1 Tax=Saccharopolyspora sp. NPDC050389 TaxID=3155516 RepID=UPI00340B1839
MSVPASADPQLAARWRRGRILLIIALGVAPALLAGTCGALASIGGGSWALLPVIAALALTAVQLGWLVLRGGTDPSSAPRVAFLAGGATVLVGLIPAFAPAADAGGTAGALFAVAARTRSRA